MDFDREHDFSVNPPSPHFTAADISFHWKPAEYPPLEFNSYCPDLFQVLNRRTPAFCEIVNSMSPSPVEVSATFVSSSPSGPVSWGELVNEAEMPGAPDMLRSARDR